MLLGFSNYSSEEYYVRMTQHKYECEPYLCIALLTNAAKAKKKYSFGNEFPNVISSLSIYVWEMFFFRLIESSFLHLTQMIWTPGNLRILDCVSWNYLV